MRFLFRFAVITLCATVLLTHTALYAQTGQIRTVTSLADDGVGSLRQALLQAQIGDTINFDPAVFPPAAPATLEVLTLLPAITIDHVVIDASNAGVILSGRRISNAGNGLVISGAGGVVIQGLQITNFGSDGIRLEAGAHDATIGGEHNLGVGPQGQSNVLSGNTGNGIWLDGATTTGNRIVGNYIGVKANGADSLPNNGSGIVLATGVQQTTIERNVISANHSDGIHIDPNVNINDVKIIGNAIGLTANRNAERANQGEGIFIGATASNVEIGGADAAQANVISGNTQNGIAVNGARQIRILHNFIGLTGNGAQAAANHSHGIFIAFDSQDVTIEQNLISGNGQHGISIQGDATQNITVRNNQIGVNVNGTVALPNGAHGVSLLGGTGIIIGGAAGQGNLISGNNSDGIYVQGSKTQVRVGDNLIGVDVTGAKAIGNQGWGIYLHQTSGQQIGVEPGNPIALRGNLISGNGMGGIQLTASSTIVVAGNLIGVNRTATVSLGNVGPGILLGVGATDNQIGGVGACQQLLTELCNLISGNSGAGVRINTLQNGANNQVVGNLIGAGVSGLNGLGNLGDGIVVEQSTNNRIAGNRVQNNGGLALRLSLGNLLQGNDFALNHYNYAQVTGGSLATANELWQRQGELDTYVVTVQDLTVPSGRELTLDGVDVRFDFGRSLIVEGKLTATGIASNPVRLSSAGRLVAPLPGDWQGILLQPGSEGRLTYTTIELAQTGVTLKGGALTLVNSVVTASRHDGIRLEGGSLQLLENNTLAANGGMALCNLAGAEVSADNVWWGKAQMPLRSDDCSIGANGVSAQHVQITQVLTDPRPRQTWQNAPVLTPGQHSFMITDPRDVQWFRVLAGARDAQLAALLQNPAHDYDLMLFSDLSSDALRPQDLARVQNIDPSHQELASIARVQNIPGDLANVEGCSPDYLGQLNDVGHAENTALLVRASCRPGPQTETVQYTVNGQSGWYYLLVAGHNGAHDAIQPYTLTIAGEPGKATEPLNRPAISFALTQTISANVQTLFLTHRARLEQRYPGQVQSLMNQLVEVASLPEVNGRVIDLAVVPELAENYTQWDRNPQGVDGVTRANLVAAQIKAYVVALRAIYPALQNILIVGGDEIVPFYRVPDEVVLANERDYAAIAQPGTALAAALNNGYFFTDNYYGSFRPLPWRGRELYLPEIALGRLVETPAEMMRMLTAFSQTPTIEARTGLCYGYDFMSDAATAYRDELSKRLIVNSFISNDWVADALRDHWLKERSDLVCLNAHFTHDYAVPAACSATDTACQDSSNPQSILSVADVAQADQQNLEGTLVFSIGCHSGLSVADPQATRSLDFAQVLVGKGTTYVANTGYGYGDASTIGYSERLMELFVQWLPRSATVGQALLNARLAYYNELGSRSLTPYDEKVLSVATLYGLPMLQVKLSQPSQTTGAAASQDMWSFGEPTACHGSLTCRSATFTPVYSPTNQAAGSYYAVQGEKPQDLLNQPILPRASVAITLPQTLARGVLFTGGRYLDETGFDPVITRIITQTTQNLSVEPAYTTTTWQPASWALINSVRTPQGRSQRLVITPAQYRATTPQTGNFRRFTEIHYTLYYTTTLDTLPPAIWQVTDNVIDDSRQRAVTVEASDFSGIAQVVVAYTTGKGEWLTMDLTPVDTQHWGGILPTNAPTLEYFVQVVDNSGNVAVHDNKGQYFPGRTLSPVSNLLFLPLIQQTR